MRHSLRLQVQAILRRVADTRKSDRALQYGPIHLDPNTCEVRLDGALLELTRAELDLLRVFLSEKPGRVFRREELIEALFGVAHESTDRTIDTHIKNLRRKIEPDRRNPQYILTVFGAGYKLGAVHET